MLTEQDDDADAFFAAYDSAKEEHLRKFIAHVNVNALVEIASRLRGGVRCRLPAFVESGRPPVEEISSQTGGQNCNLDIQFDDGETWIARLPLEEPTVLPLETREKILASEVSTLQFLSQTNLPVPRVFFHSSTASEVGPPFVLMEKLPGKPLQWSDSS